jgi:small subunit ribosomal protein S10e
LVKEQFAWRHYYWYLNNEGTNFLREYLNLPPEIVPATLKRPTRPEGAKQAKRGITLNQSNVYRFNCFWNILVETARPSSPSDQSRQDYRRGGGYDKQGEVGAGSSRPQFVSFSLYKRKRVKYFVINPLAWWLWSRPWI